MRPCNMSRTAVHYQSTSALPAFQQIIRSFPRQLNVKAVKHEQVRAVRVHTASLPIHNIPSARKQAHFSQSMYLC